MNLAGLCSFLTDSIFFLFYFQETGIPAERKRPWLKPLLLLCLLPLYGRSEWLLFTGAGFRTLLRFAVFLAYLSLCERAPLQTAAYTSLFWTTVYTLLQSVYLGPYFHLFFMEDVTLVPSPIWNQVILALITVVVRAVYYAAIGLVFPLSGMTGAGVPHLVFVAGVCLVSIYMKSTGTDLLPVFSESPVQFSAYFILLHAALLLFLLAFEYSRRKAVEYASIALQNTASQALLENVRSRQQSEESIRALRHDIKNHVLALQLLLEQGRTEEAEEYLESIRALTNASGVTFRTGNDLADGLLLQKLTPAMEQGIQAEVTLDCRAGSFLEPIDLCVLLGNSLDNAVEACMAMPPEEPRFIRVSGGVSADCLLLRVENSCSGAVRVEGLPRTTKADTALHGFGLKNIRRVLDQYHGNLTLRAEDGSRFITTMLIPFPAPTSSASAAGANHAPESGTGTEPPKKPQAL